MASAGPVGGSAGFPTDSARARSDPERANLRLGHAPAARAGAHHLGVDRRVRRVDRHHQDRRGEREKAGEGANVENATPWFRRWWRYF